MNRQGKYSYDTVLDNLKTLIVKKGLKQGFVAEQSGFTDQEFSNILNRRMLLRAEYLPDIAKALNVTPNEIFGIQEEG